MNRAAGVITDEMARPDARQDQAVRPLHTMLEGDRRAGRFQHLSGGLRHVITIIGMYKGEQSPMRLMAWDGRHAEKFVHLRRPEHAIGFEVPVP